jgi:hypothetical protein
MHLSFELGYVDHAPSHPRPHRRRLARLPCVIIANGFNSGDGALENLGVELEAGAAGSRRPIHRGHRRRRRIHDR